MERRHELSSDTVAVLGTGIMGAPMARNLAGAPGFPVRAWNRSGEKAAPLADAGAVVARHAGRGRPRRRRSCSRCSPTPTRCSTAAEAALDGAGRVGADVDRRHRGHRALRGARRASAASRSSTRRCSGRKQPAEEGKLVVLASGPDAERERLAPLFDAVGARTMWLGEAGAGTRLKLVANSWVLTLVEGLAETITLAEGLGVRAAVVPRGDRRRADGLPATRS